MVSARIVVASATGIWWPYPAEQALGILPTFQDELCQEEGDHGKEQAVLTAVQPTKGDLS